MMRLLMSCQLLLVLYLIVVAHVLAPQDLHKTHSKV